MPSAASATGDPACLALRGTRRPTTSTAPSATTPPQCASRTPAGPTRPRAAIAGTHPTGRCPAPSPVPSPTRRRPDPPHPRALQPIHSPASVSAYVTFAPPTPTRRVWASPKPATGLTRTCSWMSAVRCVPPCLVPAPLSNVADQPCGRAMLRLPALLYYTKPKDGLRTRGRTASRPPGREGTQTSCPQRPTVAMYAVREGRRSGRHRASCRLCASKGRESSPVRACSSRPKP